MIPRGSASPLYHFAFDTFELKGGESVKREVVRK